MNSRELRTLVTAFLVLALLAGSASLAITSLTRQKSEEPKSATVAKSIPKIGDKALVESIPSGGGIAGYDLAKEFSPSANPDDNYTDNLAKGLAYKFVTENPEGPDLNAGTGIMVPKDLQKVMDQYVTDAALSPTTYAINEGRIKVAKTYTKEQLDAYLATLDQIFGPEADPNGIAGLVARSKGETAADPASIEATNFILTRDQEQLYAATVPEPALELHKATLSYLELNRTLADLDYATDPLKAVVFTEKFPEIKAHEEMRLRLALDSFASALPQSYAHAQAPFGIAAAFGISKAYAVIPVSDAVNTKVSILNKIGIYGTWGEFVKNTVKNIALQILKNQIVGRIIQQTVAWVQGGGKPQFITNWKSFLKDTAKSAADVAISQIAPKLCTNLRSLIPDFTRATVPNNSAGSRDPYQPLTCTLDQVVQNVKDFYDDFRNGGWLALAEIAQPQNNVWGSIILSREAAVSQAVDERDASAQNAQANRGYTGLTRCAKYDTIDVPESQIATLQQDPNFYGVVPGSCIVSSDTQRTDACADPTSPDCLNGGDATDPTYSTGLVRYCQVKMCASDGKEQTTPGGFVADQLSKSIGGTLDNVVNANDLTGLVSVLIDSAINKLTTMATNGILGLFNGGGANNGSNNNTSTSGGGTPATGGGGATENPDDLLGIKAQAARLLAGYTESIASARDNLNQWNANSGPASSLLTSVSYTCPARAGEAYARQQSIGVIAPKITQDAQTLTELAQQITDISTAIQNATTAVAISDLLSQADPLNSAIATVETRAATRNAQLQGLQGDAQSNLANRACNVPLSPLDE